MKKYNKISFIMGCYNCAITVEESLDSIYKQNLNIDMEIICTEDGSTDETKNVLEKYKSKRGKELRIFYHPKNLGAAFAANTGCLNATGDILFRLDSDNILEPDSISPLIALLEKSGEQIASFDYYKNFYDEKVEVARWVWKHTNGICDINNVISHNSTPPAGGNYLFTKNSFIKAGGYPPGYGMDTWGFGFRQLINGDRIILLENSFYWHRLHKDTKKSEWWRGYYRGTNDRDCRNFVLEYEDLFTEESVKWLNGNDNFFMGINSGKLRLK